MYHALKAKKEREGETKKKERDEWCSPLFPGGDFRFNSPTSHPIVSNLASNPDKSPGFLPANSEERKLSDLQPNAAVPESSLVSLPKPQELKPTIYALEDWNVKNGDHPLSIKKRTDDRQLIGILVQEFISHQSMTRSRQLCFRPPISFLGTDIRRTTVSTVNCSSCFRSFHHPLGRKIDEL